MKAIVYNTYGGIDFLKLVDIERPVPKQNEVLIKICATTVTPMDWKFRSGEVLLARFMSGVRKPKNSILGVELSGQIEAVGDDIKSFKVGDLVFAATKGGGYAEYVCLPENQIEVIPNTISLAEAASITFGGTTAYHFLVDLGKIKKNDKVLINGASGGVGIFAVQIAKRYGAHVTAVCSASNVEMVVGLGADIVVDYKVNNFLDTDQRYDLIFDVVGNVNFRKCKKILAKKGSYYTTILTLNILVQMIVSKFRKDQKSMFSLHPFPPSNALRKLVPMIEEKKIKTIIGKKYKLNQIQQAHAYAEKGHAKAKTLIEIS